LTRLHDEHWRATVDLTVPTHPGEDHLGASVPAGEVIPERLRPAVEAMQTPLARRGKG
jgi:hypothetical protein